MALPTIDVKDATGATQTVNSLPNGGAAAGASSLPVVHATDDAQIGTDATGVTQLTGGTGIRGWLSGIFSKLSGTLSVSAASLPLPTGAATQTTLAAVDTKLGGTLAVSGPLTDAELRATAVPVSGTFWQATQPVSGPLTDTQLRATAVPVSGTFWQATQPVSAASLPLPAGAATSAKQPALGTAGAPSADVLSTQGFGYKSRVQITRPANVTAYTAGDVIGTTGSGVLTFLLGAANEHVVITSVDLLHEVTAIPAGMTSFRLHLYSATPPSALADNAAWDLPSGDVSSYIGYIDFGVINDLGSNLFVQVDNVLKHVVCDASGQVYGYLVTNGGWTPGANSTVFDVTLRSIGV